MINLKKQKKLIVSHSRNVFLKFLQIQTLYCYETLNKLLNKYSLRPFLKVAKYF